MRSSTFNNKTASISRTVGLLLTLFILYGTTVEAAHKHGRVFIPSNGAAAVSGTNTTESTAGTKTGCNDCLICQLHQNFSASLVSVRPNATASGISLIVLSLDPLSIQSRINTPQSGRAPPQVN